MGLTMLGLPEWLGKSLAVCLIDLSLAGDNALVIALVCMSLPPRARRLVLLLGTAGAIVLRVLMAGLAGMVLAVPGLKLAGAIVLGLVALNLALRDPRRKWASPGLDERSSVWAAALLVTLIDVLMSLDNVFALAAVAGGSWLYLGLGLLLSVSILMFGSTMVARMLGRVPGLARLGAALLGWVAGQMAVSDPLFGGSIAAHAPVLPLLVPALAAAYVYLLGRDTPVAAPPLASVAVRPPARPGPAALPARPIPPVVAAPPAPAERDTTEASGSERVVLFMFVGLFLVVGLALGLLSVFAGGLIR
jgi:YjbE family integral membrane protein